jgi:aspartate racemase
MQNVGVIGGLGPGATSWLYLEMMKRCVQLDSPTYPLIQMYSVPLDRRLEVPFVTGTASRDDERAIVAQVAAGLRALSEHGVGLVLMPCNTLHLFLEDIMRLAGEGAAPLAHMPRLACAQAPSDSRTLVLATGTTRDSGLYDAYCSDRKAFVYPSAAEQRVVEVLIEKCIEEPSFDPWPILDELIGPPGNDHDAVLVACTDLCVTGSPGNHRPVVKSLQVLADYGVDFILERRRFDQPQSDPRPVMFEGRVRVD